MERAKSHGRSTLRAPAQSTSRGLRSGAVARMLRMPVATLRIWERRYGLTQPALSPSGQRLYSDEDLRRLVLVRQLTELGHAIGSLAKLNLRQLQRVAATHRLARTATAEPPHAIELPPARPWRIAVVGNALGERLRRPLVLRRLGQAVALEGPFQAAARVAQALPGTDLDAVLFHEPHLSPDWLAAVDSAIPALADLPKAVLYGYAAEPVCEALATAGVALLREPQPDAGLAQWLVSLSRTGQARTQPQAAPCAIARSAGVVPPRRWDDDALVGFAGQSANMACECPRHIAELLVQLSHFESYGAACAHRYAADAEIHAYLQQVAATSRLGFETALEQLALHEGLLLPAARRIDPSAAAAKPRTSRSAPTARPHRGS